jgi:hypothetical protein
MQIQNANLNAQIKTIDIQMMIPDEKRHNQQNVWMHCLKLLRMFIIV